MREGKEIFNNLIQVGMIVKDAKTIMENQSSILGLNSFRVAEYPPQEGESPIRTYMGKEGNFKGRFCFYNYENLELEIIQSLEGDNIWKDFVEKNGNGLHHLKYLIDDHNEVEQYFKSKGISKIQSGESVGINKGRSWAYYDTFEALGFYTEVMNKMAGEK